MFSLNPQSNGNSNNLFGNVTLGNFSNNSNNLFGGSSTTSTNTNNSNNLFGGSSTTNSNNLFGSGGSSTTNNNNFNSNFNNNNIKNENKIKNGKKFYNFRWSPTGEILLYNTLNNFDNHNFDQKNGGSDTIRYEMNTTLSTIKKFYNDLYTNFETMQRIAGLSNQVIPDDRVREISHHSRTYLSVILAAINQMSKSQKTGSYIDDEDSCMNCDPLDNDLIKIQTPRVLEYFKQYPNKTLIFFCGSIDSIYPYLCSKLSMETKSKCILIARESNVPNSKRLDLIRTISNQGELKILNKDEYSNRYQIANENYGELDDVLTLEIDDTYLAYEREIDNLICMSTMWRVANLFYFSVSSSSNSVSPTQLLDCIELERKELLNSIEQQGTQDPMDSEYYNQIARLLVCGCIDQVIQQLNILSRAPRSASQIKSTSRKSPINLLIDILSSIPLKKKSINGGGGAPLYPNEHLIQWNKWHQETQKILSQYIESGSSSTNQVDENLLPIVKILLGDQQTIMSTCNSFLQLVVSNILFVEYTTSTTQLRQLFTQCYQTIQAPTTVDKIFLSFATKDLDITLKKIFKHSPAWLAVHLSDLLYHHPYVMRKLPNSESQLTNIREYLLSDFGQSLASDSSLLSIGCNYLKYVKNGGLEMIDQFISRQPIHFEKNAIKMLDKWATSVETKNSIYKMLSLQDFKRKRYAASLNWLMLANDNSHITLLSNYLLENQLNSEFLNDLQSLLEKNDEIDCNINNNNNNNNNNNSNNRISGNNNNNMIIDENKFEITNNSELIFLIRYRELISLWKERSFKEYSSSLCLMFKDRVIPKRFWLRLLIDCVPLLESLKNLYFTYQDTLLLQSCLEEIIQSHLFDQYSFNISNQDIQILRSALARNLAKSIIS
ncbi:nucleoporin 85 [Dictyostelium discoideum AX4]|uniref:Nuclear pore complex protein nup85 n=1 Tax=Dictyostelium discoideum TaxID=44689 RepID=NUP85_DICDI|nr:nucleoporin 85 [Dictyostelium discoideum AX4]Q54NA0.1 RecName: Full=Nuclear pore complex protein nup85; AltName: Full=Nucleoporin nup85 [Dictyostelium discoideum]EAL64782.1 nucleoporin 85 [Dictyostelium discoideum AX4]|eukprot:XP_638280.1 nucleoporin 85 [Dictyostelium discoideum AX4]